MRVGHQNVAVAADRQAGRLAVVVGGRLPLAKELAGRGEDLDAGGHIDDVEVVVAVDGHRPRPLQLTVAEPLPSPNRLQPPQVGAIQIAAGGQQQQTAGQQRVFHTPYYEACGGGCPVSRGPSFCRYSARTSTMSPFWMRSMTW